MCVYKGIEKKQVSLDGKRRGWPCERPVLYCIGLIRERGVIDESNDVVTEWMRWCGGGDLVCDVC